MANESVMSLLNRTFGVVFVLTSVLLLSLWILIPWWVNGSINQFLEWHPRFGQLLWTVKLLLGVGCLMSGVMITSLGLFQFGYKVYGQSQLGINYVSLVYNDIIWTGVSRQFTSVVLFLGYIGLSLIVGEHHPFTTVPMYNYLPKQAYVFFLRYDSLDLIPLKLVTTTTGAGVSHKFYNRPSTVNHFNENFCGNMDTALARLVFNEVVPDSLHMANLMLCRSCIDENRHFGDEIQLLYKPK